MRIALVSAVLAVLASGVSLKAADPPDLAKLTAGLASANAADQQAAIDGLADLGPQAAAATPPLITALEAKDAETRWRAARALGLIGSAKATDALRKHAADANAMVRAQSIFALGRLRADDQATLSAVVARLTDSDALVRRASVTALHGIKADRKRVIPLVVKVLEDADPAVVMPALHALAAAGEEGVPAAIEALDNKEARYWACLVLAEMGPKAKAAVPALQKTLVDERPEVRMQAIVTLGEIGPDSKPAAAALIKALEDKETSVRYAAAFALGRIGDSSAGAALDKAAKSDDHFLAELATWAAAKADPNNAEKMAAAVKLLVASLADEHQMHREAAARGLIELNRPELVSKQIDALIPTLDAEKMDRFVGAFAAQGARIVPRAKDVLKDPARRERALRILARIGPEAAPAVPELVALLKEKDPKVRTGALFVLASIGPKADAAVGPATEALADADRDVMMTAGYALGKIGPAAKAAIPALMKLTSSSDTTVKLNGVWAILKIDPQNAEHVKMAVPALAAALKHEHDFIRVEAAMSLGEVGKAAVGALPALEAAAQDPNPAVRSAALEAIKKIKG